MEQLGHNKKGRIGKMTKRMSLTWLVLILMTAATAAAQTLDAAAFSLIPPSGVGPGQFTNGNGDAAAFSTVDNEIDSWWGLGIKSPCCSNYSGYGIVFDARSGSIYTQGNIGIGTASPISALTLAGGGNPNPNTGPQINYPGENLTFVNNSLNGNFELGGIRMVQPAGYYYDRGNMVFTLGVGSGATFDAVTIQSPTGNVGIGTTAPGATLEVNGTAKVDGTLSIGNGGIYFPGNATPQTQPYTGVTCGGDYAESVDVTGNRTNYEPGDVLVIDPNAPGKFLKADRAYSTLVAGIYSTKPGTVGRRQSTAKSPDEVPMAMVGIVPAKVSAENGPIKEGDLLVASSMLGRAMKGTDRSQLTGAVIGKALGSLASGTGVIEVLVTLQ